MFHLFHLLPSTFSIKSSDLSPSNLSSKNEKPTIMDMPHLVMTQILDNVGFLAILNLRKTCKSFRNLIGDVKPMNGLKIIDIFLGHRLLKVNLIFENNSYSEIGGMTVIYEEGEKENSCVISKVCENGSVELIKTDEHFLDAFFNDFEHILRNQKSKLTKLEIKVDSFTKSEGYISSPLSQFQSIFSHLLCFRFPAFKKVLTIPTGERNRQHTKIANRMMAKFETILKLRTAPLEVKNLTLKCFESSEIFGILRFIRTSSLKGHRAFQFGMSEKKDTLVLDSTQKCETFKTMEQLGFYDFVITNPISVFLEIPELLMTRNSIFREDILNIKQAFLNNSHLKKWNLELEKSEGDEIINEVLGRTLNGQPGKWFFKTPNSKETLSIHYTKRTTYTNIVFTRINLIDVPNNALIR